MTALLDVLAGYITAAGDPWAEGHADRKAAATVTMWDAVRALAETGDPAATRCWEALTAERDYCARNAEGGSKMHRTVPYYDTVVHAEHARLSADAAGITPGADTAWCGTCRRMREVEEVDPHASAYVGNHEVEWTATRLACGHTTQGPERIVGASPGGEAAAEAMAGARTQDRLARVARVQDTYGY